MRFRVSVKRRERKKEVEEKRGRRVSRQNLSLPYINEIEKSPCATMTGNRLDASSSQAPLASIICEGDRLWLRLILSTIILSLACLNEDVLERGETAGISFAAP